MNNDQHNDQSNSAFKRTVVFVIICLISANLIGATSDIFKSFIGPLGHILGAYAIILACISIYWYKTGRYWITDKVSKVLTTIGCATVYILCISHLFTIRAIFPHRQ